MGINLFDISFLLQRYPIQHAKKELLSIQKNFATGATGYQERKKWEIFNHHIANNKVYRNFIGDQKIKDWEKIPVLTKKDIQLPLKERLSEGYSVNKIHLHNTSGSSGTPFYFAKDKFCHALSWAINYNRFGWHGINMGSDLQGRFYGIPLSKTKYYKEKIKDFLARRIRFPVFDLSDPILAKYLKIFTGKEIKYLNGYTSSLVLFAKYLKENNTVLKEVCPGLKAVFSTSEVCDDIDREIMEDGFGVKVVNEYGAAELDLIAFEDKDFDWLVNYETLFVELLDDDNKPTKMGEEGKVVITSLYNKAMPFIRYELGDRAILSDRKKGPYQVLQTVAGRTNDIAILPSGKKSPGLTFYYISKSLLEGGDFMKEFVIKQTGIDHFHFEYVAVREINNEEKRRVLEAMNTYLEPGLIASFERKEQIERTKAGKLKHFFSELNIGRN
ncbi:MAG: paaK [Ferruginibacter sp.]|nr:paaK [Ferruginibacter sp.]